MPRDPQRLLDARQIIDDSPVYVFVEREKLAANGLRSVETERLGPYRVRIDPMRQTRVYGTYDEKGTISAVGYALLATDLAENTFKVDDIVKVGTKRYRVTGPALYAERVLEVNIDLEA